MTEQLFRDIVVVTNRMVRFREEEIQGTRYLLNVRRRGAFCGLRNIWRGQTAVQVSDPTRTVIDLLDYPAIGGGVRSVFDILQNYFSGKNPDDKLLLDYAKRLGNRTVYKRLGYCAEILKLDAPELLATCRERMSTGVSLLDPAEPKTGQTLKRWNLRLNVGGLAPASQS